MPPTPEIGALLPISGPLGIAGSIAMLTHRVRREVWVGAFALSLVLNISALPRGVAIYHAFLDYDRSIPLEQRLAPFRR